MALDADGDGDDYVVSDTPISLLVLPNLSPSPIDRFDEPGVPQRSDYGVGASLVGGNARDSGGFNGSAMSIQGATPMSR